jgi:DNA repair ATPase RecN
MAGSDPKQPDAEGAKWCRAALQVNPYEYKGRNSPSQYFADEAAYNAALIAELKAQDIGMIAITDHWNVDTAQQLIQVAGQAGIVALPGFEAVSSEGVHLLVIFEKDTRSSTVNAAIGACGVDPSAANGTIGNSFKDILAAMTSRGALVIPAHANIENGGMLTRRSGQPLVEMVKNSELHAIAVVPSEPETNDQENIFEGRKPFDRVHPLSKIYADDINGPQQLKRPGAATWFKLSAPCLESLKLAVRTPATRVSAEDPARVPRALIREISWDGGFLDGVKLNLAEDLTAFIGGRGTGKSTVIESIRYVLGIAPLGAEAAADHRAIVNGVLRASTTVRIVVDAVKPRPGQYTIVRAVNEPPIVLDASQTPTALKPADVMGVVEIFGQHELAELAHDKTNVARMVQRFSGHDTTDENVEELLRQLAENRRQLATAEDQLDGIDEKLADLPRLKDQLEHFEKTDLKSKLAEQKRLAVDESVFTEGESRLEQARSIAENLKASPIITKLESEIAGVQDSPQSQTLSKVLEGSKEIAAALKKAVSQLETDLEQAASQLGQARTEWTTNTSAQREGYDSIVKELRERGLNPDAYLETTKAIARLTAKQTEREEVVARISSLKKERSTRLGQLRVARTEASKRLNSAITEANKATKGMVNLRPLPSPMRDHLRKRVNDHISGTRTQIIAACEVENFSPAAFVAAARESDEKLESDYAIKGVQIRNLRTAGENFLREFEELIVEPAVDVYMNIADKDGPTDLRRLDELSKGQRATALLLLLLGASSAPLIIDQPEDDLDNRFIYEGVVARLRELKGTRQIIVSTHNANVPVLGDAELIVTLVGDGNNGWPAQDGVGSLDTAQIRQLAEVILEGGPAAFDARQHLYGF